MSLPDKCFILADPEGRAYGLAELINEKLGGRRPRFELNPIKMNRFRVYEDKPKITKNVREGWCFYIPDSNDSPNDWLVRTSLVNQALHIAGAEKIIDVLPHMFYSRQDRKDESRVPISARLVADQIQKHADHVITLDVHAPQIQGFYDMPFDSLPSLGTVAGYLERYHQDILEENLVIVSPDAGGGTRAETFGHIISSPDIVIGYKTKVNEGNGNSKIKRIRFPREEVKGRNCMMIDDLGDSYGTFIEAHDELKRLGAKKIYGFTTHAFFTKGYGVLRKLDRLFIGDTIIQPYGDQKLPRSKRLEIIPFGPLLAESIFRTSIGESMSALWRKKIFE